MSQYRFATLFKNWMHIYNELWRSFDQTSTEFTLVKIISLGLTGPVRSLELSVT